MAFSAYVELIKHPTVQHPRLTPPLDLGLAWLYTATLRVVVDRSTNPHLSRHWRAPYKLATRADSTYHMLSTCTLHYHPHPDAFAQKRSNGLSATRIVNVVVSHRSYLQNFASSHDCLLGTLLGTYASYRVKMIFNISFEVNM
jgi:hypothetical protein